MPSPCRNMVKSLPDPRSPMLGSGMVMVVGVAIMWWAWGGGVGCGCDGGRCVGHKVWKEPVIMAPSASCVWHVSLLKGKASLSFRHFLGLEPIHSHSHSLACPYCHDYRSKAMWLSVQYLTLLSQNTSTLSRHYNTQIKLGVRVYKKKLGEATKSLGRDGNVLWDMFSIHFKIWYFATDK